MLQNSEELLSFFFLIGNENQRVQVYNSNIFLTLGSCHIKL